MAHRGDFAVNPSRSRCANEFDFHYRAVGLISKIVTDAVQLVNRVQNFFDRIGHPPALGGWQAELLEQRKNFRVKIDVDSFGRPGSVKHNTERTLRHDRRIELLE